jgi:bifunctional DNA-binding transcriptional regulator/antitoxin component of YhaV-PrlF toxin-antitoxin module
VKITEGEGGDFKDRFGNDRKVIEISGSHYINIPKTFVEKHGIRTGDILTVVVGEVMKVVVPG